MFGSAVGGGAAVVVAVVLLVAGVTKVSQPRQWRSQAADLGVPRLVAAPVPFLELVLSALLLVQLQRHVVAWFAVALFVAFTVLLVVRLAQGQRPPCACFGSLSAGPIGPGHVARNAVFIAVAMVAALA